MRFVRILTPILLIVGLVLAYVSLNNRELRTERAIPQTKPCRTIYRARLMKVGLPIETKPLDAPRKLLKSVAQQPECDLQSQLLVIACTGSNACLILHHRLEQRQDRKFADKKLKTEAAAEGGDAFQSPSPGIQKPGGSKPPASSEQPPSNAPGSTPSAPPSTCIAGVCLPDLGVPLPELPDLGI